MQSCVILYVIFVLEDKYYHIVPPFIQYALGVQNLIKQLVNQIMHFTLSLVLTSIIVLLLYHLSSTSVLLHL